MKHFFKNYFWILPVAIILLTGCSTEQEIISLDDENSKGRISFSFPISKGVSTYSTVAATGNESLFFAADMTIYMVNDLDKVEYIFSGTSIVGSGSGSTQSATITLPTDATSDKKFYFVANTSSVTSALSSIAVGSSLSDLLDATTAVQTTQLSSENGLLLTGSVTVPLADLTTIAPAPIRVTLKRRVARFDISNDATASKMTIKKVLFSNAQTTALAFADKDSLPKSKGNLPEIAFAADSKVNKGDTASVFYLYPSDSVVIQLLAETGGVELLCKLTLPEGGIKANKSYTIKANNTSKPSFEVVAEDWTAGEDIVDVISNGLIEIISSSVPEKQQEWWDAETLTYDASASGTTISLTTSVLSSAGVTVEVLDTVTGYSIVATVDTPTITYLGASYKQNVTIGIPQYTATSPLNAKVVIKNISNPSQCKTINVIRKDYYPTPHKGWAGCNIYYDEEKDHLTFDDVGITEHEQYQGVYFKWCSLYGISPEGGWGSSTIIYRQHGSKNTSGAAPVGTFWEKVPFISNLNYLDPAIDKDRRDWAYAYQLTNEDTGLGDICKHLTNRGYAPAGKKWRMPTSREFEAVDDYIINTYYLFSSQTSDQFAGTYLIAEGYRKGADTTTDPFFPPSGYRNINGGLTSVGTIGNYWSSSPSNGANSYNLTIYSSEVKPANKLSRSQGFPVRCVVE